MKSSPNKSFWSRLRLPHAFTILFFILIIVGITSLILNYAGVKTGKFSVYEDGEVVEKESTTIAPSGIINWFTAIPAGFLNAVEIIVFLIVLGGFINVVVKSRALEGFIARITKAMPKSIKEVKSSDYSSHFAYRRALVGEGFRQTWIIIPLVLFFSFCGTTYGMAEESLAFYAIIIPFAIAAGFDVFTGFLIVFLGAGVGVMFSTVNPFSILAFHDAAAKASTGTDQDWIKSSGVIWRWFSWLIGTLVATLAIMAYAASVKANKAKAKLGDMFETHKKDFVTTSVVATKYDWRKKLTVGIFLLTFVVMVLGFINWDSMLGIKWPGAQVKNGNKIGFFEGVNTFIFGNSAYNSWFFNNEVSGSASWAFGQWWLIAVSTLFLISSLVIASINWKGETNYIEEMIEGARDMIGVALAVAVARAISVLLKDTNLQILFAKGLSDALKGSGAKENYGRITVPLISYILYIPLCFFIPSTSGLANATAPTIAKALEEIDGIKLPGSDLTAGKELYSGVATGYAWGAGLANMFVPTYGVVIGALALTKMPFNRFFKAFGSFLLVFFLLGLVLVIGGGLLNIAAPKVGIF